MCQEQEGRCPVEEITEDAEIKWRGWLRWISARRHWDGVCGCRMRAVSAITDSRW